jgi:TPR repeat protein
MRAHYRRLLLLCLCGAILAACASDPEDSAKGVKTTFDAGLKAYDAGDYQTAYSKWTSIDDVDLAAMRNVAIMLRTGKGVAKNPKAAQDMMERAAGAGLVTAQADLADMLLKGEAGPPDPKTALPWLELASAAGHPIAAYQLGQLYEQGTVVKKDIEEARRLYKIAAAAGVDDAAKRLAALPPEPPQAAAPPQPAVPPQPAAPQAELRH